MACAEGSQRTLATGIVGRQDGIGLSRMALVDTGVASGKAAAILDAQGSELLAAIDRTQLH